MSPESSSQVVELAFVFLAHIGQSNHCSVLLVDQFAQGALALDKTVGDVDLAAEVGKPCDELNRVNVVGNSDELGLAVLNELGDVVESKLEVVGLGIVDFFF